jgi:hypothetical protein
VRGSSRASRVVSRIIPGPLSSASTSNTGANKGHRCSADRLFNPSKSLVGSTSRQACFGGLSSVNLATRWASCPQSSGMVVKCAWQARQHSLGSDLSPNASPALRATDQCLETLFMRFVSQSHPLTRPAPGQLQSFRFVARRGKGAMHLSHAPVPQNVVTTWLPGSECGGQVRTLNCFPVFRRRHRPSAFIALSSARASSTGTPLAHNYCSAMCTKRDSSAAGLPR